MKSVRIPFARPFFSEQDVKHLQSRLGEILNSGWLTSGPIVEEFESRILGFLGEGYCIAVNSCTAALQTIMMGLDLKSAEVIVPSNTFVSTANIVLAAGARPIFADCSRHTFNISPDSIQEKITHRTKAIVLVHLGGNPCDLKGICEIASDRGIRLIEDCAHAWGSQYMGKPCGTFGDASAFSFYATKIITSAEGGIIFTRREELAKRAKIIRNCGRAGFGPVDIVEMGHNFRLSEIHAAIGLTQLERLGEFLVSRRNAARIYDKELSKIAWIAPQKVLDNCISSYYAYIIRIDDSAPMTRDALIQFLDKRGVGTSVLYKPIHKTHLYKNKLGFKDVNLPVAEDLGEASIALPMYNMISENDVTYIVELLRNLDA